MAMTCTVCRHSDRQAIDSALLSGASVRHVAAQFGLKKSTVGEHRLRCMGGSVTRAVQEHKEREQVHLGDQLLHKLDGLLNEALAVARRAKRRRDDALLLKALSEARDTVRLMGDFTGVKPEPPPRVSYQIVFEAGRPVARPAEVIDVSVSELPLSDVN